MAMSMGSFATRTVATIVVAVDGTGDFTDIQDGIDSLPATGGCVYIKEGTYTITAAITLGAANISITGCGYSTHITPAANNVYVFDLTSAVRFELNHMRITGTTFLPIPKACLYLNNCDDGRILNCWFTATRGDVMELAGTYNNLIISDNIFYDVVGWPVRMFSSNCTFSGNRIYGTTTVDGILLAGDNNIIVNNVIVDNARNGIYVNGGESNIINNNMITGNSNMGIHIRYPAHRNVVVGNYISANDKGIMLVETIGGPPESNIVVSNYVAGNTTSQITDNGLHTQLAHNIEG